MNSEESPLPQDLIIEILSWLPPETLASFRSVSKWWCSIISDPKFVAKHQSHFGNSLRNSNSNRIVILTERHADPRAPLKLRLFPDNNPGTFPEHNMEIDLKKRGASVSCRIMGSCDGLLCLASSSCDYVGIQLCNPCVRWATRLPVHHFTDEFNPVDLYYGIGFVASVNDYKVIKLRRPITSRMHMPGAAAVFSVKAKSWKRLNVSVPPNIPLGRSVFLHGFVHWLTCLPSLYNNIKRIMLFDVCNEVFGELRLPELDRDLDTNACADTSISVVRGSLCVLVAESRTDIRCDVWVMKEYGVVESWTKQFSVVLREGIIKCVELTVGGKILCCTKEGEHRNVCRHGELRFEPSPSQLVLYDPAMDEYRYVGPAPSCKHVVSLVASLALLNDLIGQPQRLDQLVPGICEPPMLKFSGKHPEDFEHCVVGVVPPAKRLMYLWAASDGGVGTEEGLGDAPTNGEAIDGPACDVLALAPNVLAGFEMPEPASVRGWNERATSSTSRRRWTPNRHRSIT
ncbi:UNVERIFIED_CONTAM: F-box protein [Sesamum latifolium]|uniref:F-box protein n=1 Tax=Sesamum latifolium TaxID=2727402 RepID=A0AAW2XBB6_9LAMI